MLHWMIHPTYESQLRGLFATPVDAATLSAVAPSAADPLQVVNRVAKIPIRGVLLNERSRMLDLFGVPQTSYSEIAAHIREAESSSDVRSVEFHIDSPGGAASNGLVDTAELMAKMMKPNSAIVGEMAASAAYWLAAQSQTIALSGAATSVGSIGVAVDMFVSDQEISIASTDAPRKRPDVRTAKGQEDVRRQLDDLHEIFVAAVARGRGVSAQVVNERFGKGGVLLASQAIDAGMADTLLSAGPPLEARATIAAMDPEQLKAEHPAVYAAVLALGVQKERSRVCAHLTLADASGGAKIAHEHIRSGSEVDSEVTAAHTAAHMTASTAAAREASAAPHVDAAPNPIPNPNPSIEGGVSKEDIAATFAMVGHTLS